jgi:hypothetical protein
VSIASARRKTYPVICKEALLTRMIPVETRRLCILMIDDNPASPQDRAHCNFTGIMTTLAKLDQCRSDSRGFNVGDMQADAGVHAHQRFSACGHPTLRFQSSIEMDCVRTGVTAIWTTVMSLDERGE